MSESSPLINKLECKGCGRCVEACPGQCLSLVETFNERGYPYVEYVGQGCIGCGRCYYTCPEPFAIRVRVVRKRRKTEPREAKA